MNGLIARGSGKKEAGMARVTTQKNATKKTFGNRFVTILDFDFFKYPVYLYRHQKRFDCKA